MKMCSFFSGSYRLTIPSLAGWSGAGVLTFRGGAKTHTTALFQFQQRSYPQTCPNINTPLQSVRLRRTTLKATFRSRISVGLPKEVLRDSASANESRYGVHFVAGYSPCIRIYTYRALLYLTPASGPVMNVQVAFQPLA